MRSTTGTLASTVGVKNPIRYRGYYYDVETGLYYLQSRYYDPQTGRFINADDIDFIGADGSFASYNLFSYCSNNPVINSDPSGCLKASISHISKDKYKFVLKLTDNDVRNVKYYIKNTKRILEAVSGVAALVLGFLSCGVAALVVGLIGIKISFSFQKILDQIDHKDKGKGVKITVNFKCGYKYVSTPVLKYKNKKLYVSYKRRKFYYAYITGKPIISWN